MDKAEREVVYQSLAKEVAKAYNSKNREQEVAALLNVVRMIITANRMDETLLIQMRGVLG